MIFLNLTGSEVIRQVQGLCEIKKPPLREAKKTQMMKKNYFEVQRYSEEIYFFMSIINLLTIIPTRW